MGRLLRAVTAGLLLVAVASCSDAPDSPAGGPAPADVNEPLLQKPDSGGSASVTRQEFEEAVGRLGQCFSGTGITLVNGGWDPFTQQRMVLAFDAPPEMADDALTQTVDACRSRHLDQLEEAYMEEHPAVMATDLLEFTRACLSAKGIDVPADATAPKDLRRSVASGKMEDLEACALAGARKLYPGLPDFFFP